MTERGAAWIAMALAVAVSLWNIIVASRGAQTQRAHPAVRALTALSGIMLVPAMIVAIADGSLLTARVTQQIWWLWPAALACATVQATWIGVRRLVSPMLALPLAFWNALLLVVAVGRVLPDLGVVAPDWMMVAAASLSHALASALGPIALTSPLAIAPPLLASAAPSRWRPIAMVRVAATALAAAATTLVLVEVPNARLALGSYARYGAERLPDRPANDVLLGLRILPPVEHAPSPHALRLDLALADSMEAEALLVEVTPFATAAALDSLARTLESYRRDSVVLAIRVTGPPSVVGVGTVDQLMRRLHPDVLLFGSVARDDDALSDAALVEEYAQVAHRVLPRVRVGVIVSVTQEFRRSSSNWFDWARTRGKGLSIAAVELGAGIGGAADLDDEMAWLRQRLALAPSDRAVWITSIATAPVAHGEAAQALAWRGMLAVAMRTPGIRAVFAGPASDYEAMTGVRGASGRIRPVVRVLMDASRRLREASEAAAATPR